MKKVQPAGAQTEGTDAKPGGIFPALCASITGVSQKRQACMGELDADLVMPSGMQPDGKAAVTAFRTAPLFRYVKG